MGSGSKKGAGIGQARDSKAWSSGQGDRVGSRCQRAKCRLDVSAERKDMCSGPLTGQKTQQDCRQEEAESRPGRQVSVHPREDV